MGLFDSPEFQEQMALRDRGLKPQERMSARPPEIHHGDLTIDLYGPPETFIRYLQEVNGIPNAASISIEYDTVRGYRVRFEWWLVKTWESEQ